jgi:hypothetical protein
MKEKTMNKTKSLSMTCLQKGSKMAKASIFLLAALLILSLATVAIAQSRAVSQNTPTSLEEDRILTGYSMHRGADANWLKEIEHYMRDGCKKALAGAWLRDTKGDIITITYLEEYKGFVGKVTTPVKLAYNPGHLLFKVYFAPVELGMQGQGIQLPKNLDINWLREQKQCKRWAFKGTEFSFDQKTKKKTEMGLWLYLDGDRFQYKGEKQAWNFTRVQ